MAIILSVSETILQFSLSNHNHVSFLYHIIAHQKIDETD